MSFQCAANYLQENFGQVLANLSNGECRFLVSGNEATDAQGFPVSSFTPRTANYLRCAWKAIKIDEKTIATQTRGLCGYEISVAQMIGGTQIIAKPSDRLELKLKIGATESETLEIVALQNVSGVIWTIYAVDINE